MGDVLGTIAQFCKHLLGMLAQQRRRSVRADGTPVDMDGRSEQQHVAICADAGALDSGGSVEAKFDEEIIFNQLDDDPN